MKRSIIICLFPLIFSGQNMNPQSSKTNNSSEKMNERLSKDNDQQFKKMLDSINKENESLVKEINRKTDIINKNKGYIKNNERKILKQEVTYTIIAKKKKPIETKPFEIQEEYSYKIPESTIVYIPIKTCIDRKGLIGRFFSKEDCNQWSITDSIKVEIQNY